MVWPIETYTTQCSDSLLAGTYPLDVVYAPHPHGRPTHHDDSVSLYESLLSILGITDSETRFGNVRLHPIIGTELVDPIRWTDDHVHILRRWWCEGSSGTSYECTDTETYRTGRVDCGASCLETIQTETRIVHITQTCLLPCTLCWVGEQWMAAMMTSMADELRNHLNRERSHRKVCRNVFEIYIQFCMLI